MAFRAQQWVETEFEVLGRLWSAVASVPYPVQRRGREVMSSISAMCRWPLSAGPLPRAPREFAADLYRQLLENLTLMTAHGVVHVDLSPYNLLVWESRLYVIGLPQAVDPILNPDKLRLLERDVLNACGWLEKRGVAADASEVLAELMSLLF